MSVMVNYNLEGLARIKYIRKCFLLPMHTNKYINILLHTCQQVIHTQTQILFTHVCDCAHTHIRTCVLVRERERGGGRKCVYIYIHLWTE